MSALSSWRRASGTQSWTAALAAVTWKVEVVPSQSVSLKPDTGCPGAGRVSAATWGVGLTASKANSGVACRARQEAQVDAEL